MQQVMYIGREDYVIKDYLPNSIPINFQINSCPDINDPRLNNSSLIMIQANQITSSNYDYLDNLQKMIPSTPVLIINSEIDAIDIREYFRAGVKDYLLLPDEGDYLSSLIEKYLLTHTSIQSTSPHSERENPTKNAKRLEIKSHSEKAITYIYENYNRKIKLEELANMCHMHPNTFARKFKESQGCTIREFIKNHRLKCAMQLLHRTDFSIEKIAYEVGFETVSLFNRLFKQNTGTSPSVYRKTNN